MVEAKGLEGLNPKNTSFCFPCSKRHCNTRRWNVLPLPLSEADQNQVIAAVRRALV